MKRLKQKLHSRRGASLLLAMLLMLVVAMISAVIVSAAVTSTQRIQLDSREEQEMFTIDSAAKAMVKYLDGAVMYKSYVSEPNNPKYLSDPYYGGYDSGSNSSSSTEIMEYFAARLPGSTQFTLDATVTSVNTDPGYEDAGDALKDATATLELKSATENPPQVNGELTITTTDYKFAGTVYSVDPDAKTSQKLYLTCTVTKTVEVDEIDITVYQDKDEPNPDYDGNDDVPATITVTYSETVDGTKTTTKWSMSNLRLTTKEP